MVVVALFLGLAGGTNLVNIGCYPSGVGDRSSNWSLAVPYFLHSILRIESKNCASQSSSDEHLYLKDCKEKLRLNFVINIIFSM